MWSQPSAVQTMVSAVKLAAYLAALDLDIGDPWR